MSRVRTSTINFGHFLNDLIGMYDCSVDETVLVELIANSLDARSSRIAIDVNRESRTFSITDNGDGMTKRGFEDYHNFAFSVKRRGQGIGFAGLGAKLGLKISESILTETKSARFARSSRWWFDKQPRWEASKDCSLTECGTRTLLNLDSDRYLILEPQQVRDMLFRHYLPLFLPEFAALYAKTKIYRNGVTFTVNGETVTLEINEMAHADERDFAILRARSRNIGMALFMKSSTPLPSERQGLAICTYGKVIRRDWLDKHPRQFNRISGIVEVPPLVQCLTTNKSDFVKHGTDGRRYYELRRGIQRAFGNWLEQLGEVEQTAPRANNRKLERTLHDILRRMPEFAGFYSGGRRIEAQPTLEEEGDLQPVSTAAQREPSTKEESKKTEQDSSIDIESPQETAAASVDVDGVETAGLGRKPARTSPGVTLLQAPEDSRISWVDGNTIVINASHPAYRRAEREKHADYHNLWAAASALIEVSGTDPSSTFRQLSAFLQVWGEM